MKPIKIIDVYQTVWDDTDGTTRPGCTFYSTFHNAQVASSSMGGPPSPKSRKAVELEDGQIWVLDEVGPRTLYHKTEDAKREAALSKLTKEERELLGLEKT